MFAYTDHYENVTSLADVLNNHVSTNKKLASLHQYYYNTYQPICACLKILPLSFLHTYTNKPTTGIYLSHLSPVSTPCPKISDPQLQTRLIWIVVREF